MDTATRAELMPEEMDAAVQKLADANQVSFSEMMRRLLAALQAYEDALSLCGAGTGFEAEIAAAKARFDELRRVALRRVDGLPAKE